MTLQQLKYVVEVAEKGSISEAAQSLFVAQPSLSNAIKELEKELNLTIFHRTNRGIQVSAQGDEFLGYARQVLEQTNLLEARYFNGKVPRQKFSVSTQHYSFAVNAFVDLIQEYGFEEYDFTLRETRTHEIIEDVSNMRSEIGILYQSTFNEKIISKLLRESNLQFELLVEANPHVFVSSKNPLAKKLQVELEELENYPCLSFEQGTFNSFYYSEEILSTREHSKQIKVSDRATLFNLVIGLNGYTISTGIISEDLNGTDIIAVPLKVKEIMQVGIVTRKNEIISKLGQLYIEFLRVHTNSLL